MKKRVGEPEAAHAGFPFKRFSHSRQTVSKYVVQGDMLGFSLDPRLLDALRLAVLHPLFDALPDGEL